MAGQGNVFTVLGVSLKLYNNEDPLKILWCKAFSYLIFLFTLRCSTSNWLRKILNWRTNIENIRLTSHLPSFGSKGPFIWFLNHQLCGTSEWGNGKRKVMPAIRQSAMHFYSRQNESSWNYWAREDWRILTIAHISTNWTCLLGYTHL